MKRKRLAPAEGITDPRNKTSVAGTRTGDMDCRRVGVTVVSFWMAGSENISPKS
jgi:hypothetical protein